MSSSTATTPIGPSRAIQMPERGEQQAAGSGFRLPLDPALTLAAIGLAVCSIVTLEAATRHLIPANPRFYVDRQITYLIVGGVGMLLLSRLDYARLRQFKNVFYALLILSILAVFGLGHSANGAQRAISVPFFSFQASEIGKVLLILSLAALVVDRARRLHERDTTARVMLAALVPATLVIAQPDLGSGMVYTVIAFTLLFVAGTPWRQLAALVALVIVALAFVPESHTDFIFAAVGEQYGFLGAALVLCLYALLISRALRILVMAKDLFGSLVAAGVTAMLMFQVFVNVGMTIGIMPITGVTLPLMSYGGSSVITTLLAVGLLQSIYVQARASEALKGRVLRY